MVREGSGWVQVALGPRLHIALEVFKVGPGECLLLGQNGFS